MKGFLLALLLLPSFAVAQGVTHEQIEQAYSKCDRIPHHFPPGPMSVTMNMQPTWDDPDPTVNQACAAIWTKRKALKDEINSKQTKDELKGLAGKLK